MNLKDALIAEKQEKYKETENRKNFITSSTRLGPLKLIFYNTL